MCEILKHRREFTGLARFGFYGSMGGIAVEAAAMPSEDLLRWGVTQGGLFLLALFMAYYIRQLHESASNEQKERLVQKDGQLEVLTKLVADTHVALTKIADALQTQGQTLQSQNAIIAKIDERRNTRDPRER